MKIITKQVSVKRTLINDEIEKSLQKYGEPIRWAVVDADSQNFIIEAVFLSE